MNKSVYRTIQLASKKYSEYMGVCQIVAREAQKHIDWDDDVSCMYYPADGICIEIDANVCPASRFFQLLEESQKDKLDKRTYLLNCI